jgi:hypothetical protein
MPALRSLVRSRALRWDLWKRSAFGFILKPKEVGNCLKGRGAQLRVRLRCQIWVQMQSS